MKTILNFLVAVVAAIAFASCSSQKYNFDSMEYHVVDPAPAGSYTTYSGQATAASSNQGTPGGWNCQPPIGQPQSGVYYNQPRQDSYHKVGQTPDLVTADFSYQPIRLNGIEYYYSPTIMRTGGYIIGSPREFCNKYNLIDRNEKGELVPRFPVQSRDIIINGQQGILYYF